MLYQIISILLIVVGLRGLCVMSIRKKVLVEIIEGIQIYREKTIEHDDLDFDLNCRQSELTQKIVKKIKTNLKIKGKI